MAKLCTLYSGSSGNSTYLENESGAALLVDVGKTMKATREALAEMDRSLENVKGILLTHEHIDHIKGLKVLTKHYPMPIYGRGPTLAYLAQHDLVAPSCQLIELTEGENTIADFGIRYFDTPHDSVCCCGYQVTYSGGQTAAITTDLGYIDDTVVDTIAGCDTILIESNYDEKMLDFGPYPYYLKRRIKGSGGHLSNAACSKVLPRLVEAGAKHIILGHLSEQNNLPALALETAACALKMSKMKPDADCTLQVASRHMLSCLQRW